MSSQQSNKDKPRASKCHQFFHPFDSHNYCPTCRESGKGDDPCVTLMSPCEICASFTEEQQTKITHRKRYIKRGDKKTDKNDDEDADLLGDNSIESFGGSHAELEVAAERLFTSQQKVQSNFEKSLGSRLDIQIDQKMGAFQASTLEAMNNLREDFQKSLQKSKQVEVDQTSASTSKPVPSQSKNLDPSKTSAVKSMDVDYGPALPPRLDSYDSRVDDASGHLPSSVEDPLRVPSARPKKSSHSFKQYDGVPSSASDHYSDPSDDPQPAPSRPKKHSDKTKHKSRSRFLPSSSEEDQSPECRHTVNDLFSASALVTAPYLFFPAISLVTVHNIHIFFIYCTYFYLIN